MFMKAVGGSFRPATTNDDCRLRHWVAAGQAHGGRDGCPTNHPPMRVRRGCRAPPPHAVFPNS